MSVHFSIVLVIKPIMVHYFPIMMVLSYLLINTNHHGRVTLYASMPPQVSKLTGSTPCGSIQGILLLTKLLSWHPRRSVFVLLLGFIIKIFIMRPMQRNVPMKPVRMFNLYVFLWLYKPWHGVGLLNLREYLHPQGIK